MKRLLVLCILLISTVAKGQSVKWELCENNRLDQTTTIFFVSTEDEDSIRYMQKILDSVWTYNSLLVVPYSEREAYAEDISEYSFFVLGGSIVETTHSRNLYLSLNLIMLSSDKKEIKLGGVNLYSTSKVRWDAIKANHYGKLKEFNLYLHEKELLNLNLGFIKNYLSLMSSLLEDQKDYKKADAAQIPNLKKDTLYIPDYTFRRFSNFSAREKKPYKPADLLEEYKFPYKVITTSQLSNKILTASAPFYYLDYTMNGTYSYFDIRNSNTGEEIYSYGFNGKGKLKSKRFKKMYNDIKASGG